MAEEKNNPGFFSRHPVLTAIIGYVLGSMDRSSSDRKKIREELLEEIEKERKQKDSLQGFHTKPSHKAIYLKKKKI